jgi:prepilin-type N-terminal cleavage/methylation domain-containing protein
MKYTEIRSSIDDNGFTFIEMLVAIMLLSVGIVALFSMQVTAIDSNSIANRMTERTNWASDRVEILLNRPYDCTPAATNCSDLNDDDGDGTNQDADKDGVDDDGGNFGLDDNTPATADGRDTSPDGFYTILWNVALDQPISGCKTIRVIVQSSLKGQTKQVVMTYIKADTP